MKKWLSVLLLCTMLFSFAACDMEMTDASGDGSSVVGSVDKPTENPNRLGDYLVEIKSCRLAKDYSGEDVVIVTYAYTNEKNETPKKAAKPSEKEKAIDYFSDIVAELDDDSFSRLRSKIDFVDNYIRYNCTEK